MSPLDRQPTNARPRASAIRAAVKVENRMVPDDSLGDICARATPGLTHEQIAIGQFDGVRSDESATLFTVSDEDARLVVPTVARLWEVR